MILKPDCLGVDRMSHPPGLEPHTSRAEVGNAYHSATRSTVDTDSLCVKKSHLEFQGGGRVVRWCWVNFQCRCVLQFGLQ